MNERNSKSSAVILLIITAVMWSLGGILIKSINAHSLAIAGVRSAISCVIISLYVRKPKFTWSFTQLGAAVAYALTVILFVAGTKLTTAANAILLQYTAPVFVALLGAWLLKEKPGLVDWLTILVVIGGMILFFMDSIDIRGFLGNILALSSGVSFALFTILMRMQKDGSPIESVILGNAITAVAGVPFIFTAVHDTKGWVCLIILGVVQLGIPYILFSKAIKSSRAIEASLITMIEPVLNPVWVSIIIGEVPGILSIAGGVIVITAVAVRCIIVASGRFNSKESHKHAVC
ncbi:MAG TPA: EamA family transporter [Clostridiaceae bacterium]|nr:EamA family transporter [Clostridiaceae bacterium]